MTPVTIVGAGPAGASLAYLLARNGIEVTLLERRRDFAREFRGEVLMPSGVDAFAQMGLLDQLQGVAHHTQELINLYLNGRHVLEQSLAAEVLQGLSFMAVSQPQLLEMLVRQCQQFENFRFIRGATVRDILRDGDAVTGVRIGVDSSEQIISSRLLVGADGRHSVVRRELGFTTRQISPPMDIVWCKLPLPAQWQGVRGYAGRGHLLVAYHTWGDHLQLGWVILKGTFGDLRSRGVEQWVEEMADHVSNDFAEHLRRHLDEIQRPFLLDAASECVTRWHQPGVLLIGDAAHTMSPVGGQGINIALRDALVAANHLVPALGKGDGDSHGLELNEALSAIQTERIPEVSQIQNMQAVPPRFILSRAWWGEPLRNFAVRLLTRTRVRNSAAERIQPFLYGVTQVQLKV